MGKVFGSCQTGGGLWLRLLPGRGGWRRWGALWDWRQYGIGGRIEMWNLIKTREEFSKLRKPIKGYFVLLSIFVQHFSWISLGFPYPPQSYSQTWDCCILEIYSIVYYLPTKLAHCGRVVGAGRPDGESADPDWGIRTESANWDIGTNYELIKVCN